jgi:hypothetical protein
MPRIDGPKAAARDRRLVADTRQLLAPRLVGHQSTSQFSERAHTVVRGLDPLAVQIKNEGSTGTRPSAHGISPVAWAPGTASWCFLRFDQDRGQHARHVDEGLEVVNFSVRLASTRKICLAMPFRPNCTATTFILFAYSSTSQPASQQCSAATPSPDASICP